MDLANWALRTSPKFATGVKHQFHQGLDQIRDPEIPMALRLQYQYTLYSTIYNLALSIIGVQRTVRDHFNVQTGCR